jgi:hypothetical protein
LSSYEQAGECLLLQVPQPRERSPEEGFQGNSHSASMRIYQAQSWCTEYDSKSALGSEHLGSSPSEVTWLGSCQHLFLQGHYGCSTQLSRAHGPTGAMGATQHIPDCPLGKGEVSHALLQEYVHSLPQYQVLPLFPVLRLSQSAPLQNKGSNMEFL